MLQATHTLEWLPTSAPFHSLVDGGSVDVAVTRPQTCGNSGAYLAGSGLPGAQAHQGDGGACGMQTSGNQGLQEVRGMQGMSGWANDRS